MSLNQQNHQVNYQYQHQSQHQYHHNLMVPILPYRAKAYTMYDTDYATNMYKCFLKLSPIMQDKFNDFTKQLMYQDQINKFSLIRAINDFKKIHCKNISNYNHNRSGDSNGNSNGGNDYYYNYILAWSEFQSLAVEYTPPNSCAII